MQDYHSPDPKLLGPILLDVGLALLCSGASSNRIQMVVKRIGSAYQFTPIIVVGPRSVEVSLQLSGGLEVYNSIRNTSDYGVNFSVLSGLSTMSQTLSEKPWPLADVKKEVERIIGLPPYPRMMILFAVAVAGAAFCYTFGGDAVEMSIAFGATFSGLFVKQELIKRSANTYICTFLSALVALLFVGAFYMAGLGIRLEYAFATCVLFLIPGVPLINFFIDLLAGNIIYGLERGINALIHVMAIAFALAAVFLILNFQA